MYFYLIGELKAILMCSAIHARPSLRNSHISIWTISWFGWLLYGLFFTVWWHISRIAIIVKKFIFSILNNVNLWHCTLCHIIFRASCDDSLFCEHQKCGVHYFKILIIIIIRNEKVCLNSWLLMWYENIIGDSIAWNYVCCSDHPKHLKQPTSPWMCSVSKSWASELQRTHRDRVYSLFLEKKKWKKNIKWTLRTFRGKSHEERKHFLNCPWTIRIVQSSLNKCCWMQTLNTTLFDGVWKQCVIFI